jgi:hypothetical protein
VSARTLSRTTYFGRCLDCGQEVTERAIVRCVQVEGHRPVEVGVTHLLCKADRAFEFVACLELLSDRQLAEQLAISGANRNHAELAVINAEYELRGVQRGVRS